MSDSPAGHYQRNIAAQSDKLQKLEALFSRLSVLRLIVFFGGGAFVILLYNYYGPYALISSVAIVLLIFIPLVRRSAKVEKEIAFCKALLTINRNESAYLEGDLSPFFDGRECISADHPYTYDLDIFGPESLFQRVNRTCTSDGHLRLGNSLKKPFLDQNFILQRQSTVKELSAQLDFRQRFLATAEVYRAGDYYRNEFETWLDSKSIFLHRKERWFWLVSPYLCAAFAVAPLFTQLSFIPFGIYFFFQLFLTGRYVKNMGKIYARVSRLSGVFKMYGALLTELESSSFNSVELIKIKNDLLHGKELPSRGIRKLFVILINLDAQLNVILAPILNGLFLWNIHYTCQLERWKEQYRAQFPRWLDCLARIDELISVSNYAFNHPDFVFPELSEANFAIHAASLAHPFLPLKTRIGNDFDFESENLILLTGANMAGKSTFLRAVGLNIILGMTGLPVCARSLTFSPIEIYSSLRTSDSISRNESFFLAEIKKLKTIIELYEAGRKIFILLDEILKGTNSKDQHLGSEQLIGKLLRLGVKGIIATHDVDLGNLARKHPSQILNACFEVELHGDEFSFDYKLKPGVCQTMNASVLMRKMKIID